MDFVGWEKLLKILVRWLSHCVLGTSSLLITVIVSVGRRNKNNALFFIYVTLMYIKQIPGTETDRQTQSKRYSVMNMVFKWFTELETE